MSLEALKQAATALRELAHRPDMHFYPHGGRRDYASVERVAEVADQLDQAIAMTPWIEGENLLALVAHRDAWRATAEEWAATHDVVIQRYNELARRSEVTEAELTRVYAAAGQVYLEHVALLGELDDTQAEAEGLAQALRDQEEVLDILIGAAASWKIQALQLGGDLRRTAAENARLEALVDSTENLSERLSDRLVDLSAGLSGLCSEMGIDPEDLDEDEVVDALRDAIATLKRPRPSLLSRLFC